MKIFNKLSELKYIREILERNNLKGKEIFFNNCIYTNENDQDIELISVKLDFDGLVFKLDENGEINKQSNPSYPIITLCYLKLQQFERNFNK